MKRDEMVEILKQSVLKHMNCECCYNDFMMYSSILKELEDAGLKPPKLSQDKCQALMAVYYGGYTFNQWDEDFSKDEKAVAALERRQEHQKLRNLK
jgi:hypothetical protein